MKKIIFSIAVVAMSSLGWAQTNSGSSGDQTQHHRRLGPGFVIGICVGQALAQQGITLPTPSANQPPSDADREKIKQEIESVLPTCLSNLPQPTQGGTPPSFNNGTTSGGSD